MKIRADRKELASTVAWVAQALPRNADNPVMPGIRLRATGDRLILSAFDYDVHHEARMSVEVIDDGECLVSGAFLRTITAALSAKSVELVLDDQALTITAGRSTYRANLLKIENYPTVPAVPPSVGTIDAGLLADGITTCLGPVDDAAPVASVAGLRFEAEGGELEIVGTDGRLLIHRALDWSGEDFAATLPSKAVAVAASGLAGAVTVGVTESSLGLSDADRTVVLRTISTPYAKWRVVPRPADDDRFAVLVDRDELAEAVKRAALLTKADKEAGAVSLTIEPDSIEITAADATAGGSEVVDAEGNGSEVIPFSPAYLSQALAAMEPGLIRLGIGRRRSPDMAALATIRPAQRATTDDRESVLAARRGGQAR